ncbi:BRO family protein, partial [Acinetobacter baumannii]|uniref:BRO family protein n=1 Tax=Acinetobacter baumannii TaxID=470 RepID=UPI00117845CE
EQFSFNDEIVRFVHVKGFGKCLVIADFFRAAGYNRQADLKAMLRLASEEYKVRVSDACVDLEGVLKSEYTQPNTILLKESGLYCFLLRCVKPEAESFMKWVVETILPREVRNIAESIDEKDSVIAL